VTPPPSEQQVFDLADRALALAGPSAQVTAWWELRLSTHPDPHATRTTGVEFVCVDRGVGRAFTTDVEDAGLEVAAGEARRRAAEGADEPGAVELPAPTSGRAHTGWEPAVLDLDLAAVARDLGDRAAGVELRWRAGAARSAIVSTAGVRSFEQRTHAAMTLSQESPGRQVVESAAAVGPGQLDLDDVVRRVRTLAPDKAPGAAPRGAVPVVLGPAAVAVVLDLVRPQFGRLAVRGASAVTESLGSRMVAPCINLSDSPRFPGTLPRSYDAEGLPRQPLPLVQDGVAHRVVRDTASPGGPSTGHATVALRAAPEPQHLVLVGGGASEEAELMSTVARGVFIPALSPDGGRVLGAFAIENGSRGEPLADAPVEVDGLAVLASAQALTMRQQLVPTGDPSARTIAGSMCPALRATSGVVFTDT